jgi:hypothetical protein
MVVTGTTFQGGRFVIIFCLLTTERQTPEREVRFTHATAITDVRTHTSTSATLVAEGTPSTSLLVLVPGSEHYSRPRLPPNGRGHLFTVTIVFYFLRCSRFLSSIAPSSKGRAAHGTSIGRPRASNYYVLL